MTCLTCSLSETQMHGNDEFLHLCDHSCQLWGRRPRGAELGRGPVPPGQRGGFGSGHRSHHERHQWQDLPGEHSAGHRHAGGRKPSHPGELVGVSGLQNVQHKHFRGRKASCINETQHSPCIRFNTVVKETWAKNNNVESFSKGRDWSKSALLCCQDLKLSLQAVNKNQR